MAVAVWSYSGTLLFYQDLRTGANWYQLHSHSLIISAEELAAWTAQNKLSMYSLRHNIVLFWCKNWLFLFPQATSAVLQKHSAFKTALVWPN